jgi:signal transduction histidine kinase
VSIVDDGSALQIRVRDDGVGLPAEWSFERDAGVGLKNVADRLEHIYGTPHLMKLVRVPTGGVEVQIAVPEPPAGRANTTEPAVTS